MLLDSGTLEILRGTNTAPAGEAPEMTFQPFWVGCYGQKTVGITRYYTAQQHGDRPDVVVEIQRNYEVSTADRVVLSPYDHRDQSLYKVTFIQHLLDEDGLPVTDLTLERNGELDGST